MCKRSGGPPVELVGRIFRPATFLSSKFLSVWAETAQVSLAYASLKAVDNFESLGVLKLAKVHLHA